MTAELLPDSEVHYCVICGPVLREYHDGRAISVTWHKMLPHPEHGENTDTPLPLAINEDTRDHLVA